MTDQYPPGYLESQGARIPVGRKGDPAELAADRGLPGLRRRAATSPARRSPVDGGMTIT